VISLLMAAIAAPAALAAGTVPISSTTTTTTTPPATTTPSTTTTTTASTTTTGGAAPVVTRVSPNVGTSFGLTSITGENLGNATAVDFGTQPNWLFGSPATAFYQVSNTLLIALVPPLPVGTVDVTVTTANGTSATSRADHYTYVNPLTWLLSHL
jgi:hypothetical protein